MGFLSRLRRRKNPYSAATEEEQIARYVYLLNTLPASVIESAHASAFRDLPASRRRELFGELRPFMSDAERAANDDDPNVLAKLVRRAEERRASRAGGGDARGAASVATREDDARPVGPDGEAIDPRDVLMRSGVSAVVAYQFVTASAVTAYFTVGAGSLVIADQPGWVGDMVDPGAGGIDAGGAGGGFDGGGFGGGFDGGGFGGGFGGGGFG